MFRQASLEDRAGERPCGAHGGKVGRESEGCCPPRSWWRVRASRLRCRLLCAIVGGGGGKGKGQRDRARDPKMSVPGRLAGTDP